MKANDRVEYAAMVIRDGLPYCVGTSADKKLLQDNLHKLTAPSEIVTIQPVKKYYKNNDRMF